MDSSQLSIKTIIISVVGLIMAVIASIFIWKYVNDDKSNKAGSLKRDGEASVTGQTVTNLPVVTPTPPVTTPPVISKRATSPVVTSPASEQDIKEVIFTLKEKHGKHFEEFKTIFNEILKDNPNYIYSNNRLSEEVKKRYNDIKDELVLLLQAMAYHDIFIMHTDLGDNYIYYCWSLQTKVSSGGPEIREFSANTANKDESEAMFKKILSNSKLVNRLCISHKRIQKLKTIDLGSFTFNTLPKAFGVLKSLETVDLNDTGIRDLEPLNEAKNLDHIFARNNKITAIEGLKNLTKLKCLDIRGNNITKIDKDFLANHSKITYHGIILSLKQGDRFPDEVQGVIDASKGKVKVTTY